MSSLDPSLCQQPALQVAQNTVMQHSAEQTHKQPGLPYGLSAKSPVSLPYHGLIPQPTLPNSTTTYDSHRQVYHDMPTSFHVPRSPHAAVDSSTIHRPDVNASSNVNNFSGDSFPASGSFAATGHSPSYSKVENFGPRMENGPYASPNYLQAETNSVQNSSTNVNGVSGNHVESLAPSATLHQWAVPPQMSPAPAQTQMLTKQDPSPGPSANLPIGNRVLHPVPECIGSQAVSETNLVPSSGLPLPYNNQSVLTSSPQVTPGPSRPSNSSSNLLNMGRTPSGSNVAHFSTNYQLSSSNGGSYSQSSVALAGANRSDVPPTAMPFPNVSPLVSQSAQNSSNQPRTLTQGATPIRPRYPQHLYSQPNQCTSPAMTSQSIALRPQTPTSMYNSSPQPPFSPFPAQSGVPDGPVGGVSGYDPQLHAKMAGMSVHSSFSRLWGSESMNLLQDKNILPPIPLEPPKPVLSADRPNCSPNIFRCTLTKVPENSSLLQKSRLPFGILIHPFRDLANLPVIQCNTIVRCRNCRTYINPFITFVDQRRWKCNLCFRVNDLPEEFLYDPITRSYGDPSRRPEIKNATIEFIAPSDYMLRPPQPAVYLFLLDVSHGACETGYLQVFCKILLDQLDDLPGDSRTRIGFITYDGSIHFYNLADGMNQPHMLIVSDVEDVFLPSPDNLLVNLYENKALIRDLLEDIPKRFSSNWDSNSCLGAALQAAYKLMAPVGGRVTVVQTCLVNYGPGALKNREDPNQRAAKDVTNVGPANDYYKKLSLECSSQQIAVDLFVLCSQYLDIATVSCISKFSSGIIQYYPGFHHQLCQLQVERFSNDLRRYLTRRIGFEAVMRIRCTRGLAIHTFHGNFFVRSTDLLSLPNVNPDVGFGMQISIEESLAECNSVCFQAAVLYTSSNGERRIRVHTLCLPVVSMLNDIWGGADQEAIICLVSKMAVDRSASSLSDARDALINVSVDLLGAFKQTLQTSQTAGALVAPYSTRLIPLFVLALLKHMAFRSGVSTKLDERVFAMERMKTLPLLYLMKYIYPTLYPVHALDDKNGIHQDDDAVIPQPVILQLSSEKIDRHGAYILDTFDVIYLYVGRAVNDYFCQNVLGVPNFSAIPEDLNSLPELHTPESERMRIFVSWLQDQRPSYSPLMIIREDSSSRHIFLQYMLGDRTESLFSYYEFLQNLKQQIAK